MTIMTDVSAMAARLPGSPQSAWLTGRGISPQTQAYFRLGVVDPADGPAFRPYAGRISVPYLTPAGVRKVRYRLAGAGQPKILDTPGGESMLYNVQALHGLDETIWIAEGEPDTWTLHQLGLPVVGVSGAKAWQRHYRHLFTHRRVRVACHGDQAGRELGATIAADIKHAAPVHLPDGKDVNDLLQCGGSASILEALGIEEEQ